MKTVHQHTFGPVSSETNLWVWLLGGIVPEQVNFSTNERGEA